MLGFSCQRSYEFSHSTWISTISYIAAAGSICWAVKSKLQAKFTQWFNQNFIKRFSLKLFKKIFWTSMYSRMFIFMLMILCCLRSASLGSKFKFMSSHPIQRRNKKCHGFCLNYSIMSKKYRLKRVAITATGNALWLSFFQMLKWFVVWHSKRTEGV